MLVVAHRGYSSRYPENSSLAFAKAIEANADYIETDLRFSRDGVIVCCHDPNLKRIAGRADAIAELNSDDIQNTPLINGQFILRLHDVLQIVCQAGSPVRVMFDVKITTDAMLDAALPLVEEMGMAKKIMYGARTIDHAKELKKRNSDIAILGMPKKPALIPEFVEAGVSAIRVWEEDITGDVTSEIHGAGLPIWVTAGLRGQGESAGDITADRLMRLNDFGTDAVLVNDPQLACQMLKQNIKMPVGASS